MARVYDLIEEPPMPRDAVVARLRELAARPALPDPRTVPFTVPTITKARWHTILSGVVLVAFLGLIWWALLSVGGAG